MLNAHVTSIFAFALIFNGAFIQLDLNSGITRGNFQKATISQKKPSQNYHSRIFHLSAHHVETIEEEEDNKESQKWDDEMSDDGKKKYNSTLSKKYLTAYYQITLINNIIVKYGEPRKTHKINPIQKIYKL